MPEETLEASVAAPKTEAFSSIRQAAQAKGVSEALLRRAKNLNCPGFETSGRVKSALVEPCLAEHPAELQAADENSKDYWTLLRLKYQAKREQLAYEQD